MKLPLYMISILLIITGLFLSFTNLYGLNRDIRPVIHQADLRFQNDVKLTYEQALERLKKADDEDESSYNQRATITIADTLAHIQWNEEFDVTRYHQLIPFWENYILYLIGVLTPIPEYQKYHFADYRRSLERGIGICGDASMIMSQVLEKQSIDNQIVSFPGHVVVAAKQSNGAEEMYDADFGVHVPHSIAEINASPSLVRPFYLAQGFSVREVNTLVRSYGKKFERWNGTRHFITNKYYFEYFSYWAKWLFPLLCLILGGFLLKKSKIQTSSSFKNVD